MSGSSLTRKICEEHLVEGTWERGASVALKVDQVLTHDALGGLVFLQFASLGLDRVRVDPTVIYADHNVFGVDPRMARDHRFLRAAARRFGAYFSRPGTGICHQVHLERFAVPGRVLIGSDSHTPTCGGVGMFAVGTGGLDVTMALAGAPWRTAVPEVVEVRLDGELPPWSTAKDVILELLRRLGVKGGVGRIFEFTGPGVATLSVPERATIANMCTELGATTAVFPSDGTTRAFFEALGRAGDWVPLAPDAGAAYEGLVEVDLGAVEPLVARPGSPGDVVAVSEVAGTRVEQVLVGSCTNGAYPDLVQFAWLPRGRRVHPDVDVIVNPSSRSSLEALERDGLLEALLASGVIVSEATCGPCIGLAHAPAPGAASLRTFNRNFPGRSGTRPDAVYLASPLVAAVAALHGEIVDPREHARSTGEKPPPRDPGRVQVPRPEDVLAPPPPGGAPVELPVAGRMSPGPRGEPLPEDLEVEVVGVFGDDVSTDDICPAGPEGMASVTEIDEMAGQTFSRLDPGFAARAQAAGAGAIVAGENYGQGSSRENAAMAPRHLGVRVVLARSFARIHRSNLVNWGVVPLIWRSGELRRGDRLSMPGLRAWLTGSTPGSELTLSSARGPVVVSHDLDQRERLVLLSGGLLPAARAGEVAAG